MIVIIMLDYYELKVDSERDNLHRASKYDGTEKQEAFLAFCTALYNYMWDGCSSSPLEVLDKETNNILQSLHNRNYVAYTSSDGTISIGLYYRQLYGKQKLLQKDDYYYLVAVSTLTLKREEYDENTYNNERTAIKNFLWITKPLDRKLFNHFPDSAFQALNYDSIHQALEIEQKFEAQSLFNPCTTVTIYKLNKKEGE